MADRYYDRDDRGREAGYGRHDRWRDDARGRNDRDFFERAGDEVRSWFGDEEAGRRREFDERRADRDRYAEHRSREYGWREPRGDDIGERRGEDWRGRPADEWMHRDDVRSSGRYSGGMDARDWSMRDRGRDDGPRSTYFTSERSQTSGRGRDYGDDDRSWVGGGTHWGREHGRGPDSHRNAEWTGRFTGRGPRGYQRSDERIREDVCDRLTMHGDVDASNVEVEVVGAEVTLRGTVDSRMSRRLAEDVAESVPGVRHVHNEVRVGQVEASGTGGAGGGFNAGTGGIAGASNDARAKIRT